jgi:hypothetical protein
LILIKGNQTGMRRNVGGQTSATSQSNNQKIEEADAKLRKQSLDAGYNPDHAPPPRNARNDGPW